MCHAASLQFYLLLGVTGGTLCSVFHFPKMHVYWTLNSVTHPCNQIAWSSHQWDYIISDTGLYIMPYGQRFKGIFVESWNFIEMIDNANQYLKSCRGCEFRSSDRTCDIYIYTIYIYEIDYLSSLHYQKTKQSNGNMVICLLANMLLHLYIVFKKIVPEFHQFE